MQLGQTKRQRLAIGVAFLAALQVLTRHIAHPKLWSGANPNHWDFTANKALCTCIGAAETLILRFHQRPLGCNCFAQTSVEYPGAANLVGDDARFDIGNEF